MQAVQYTERAPVYSDKGAFVATGLVQHSVAPSIHPATKQVLLDTRDDKLRISYQQPVDKETLNTQPAGSYETKGEERLDTSSPLNKPDLVQQMSRPLPAVPLSAPAPIPAPAPVLTPAPAVQSGGVIDRLTSESEPRYVTVYEDGAALFSPRTINLLGTAARLPPPAPPTEPSTPTAAMQSPARSASMNNPLTTESVVAASAVSSTLPNTTAAPAPIAPAPVAVQSTQAPAAVAVPSWPPTESDHNTAAVSRVVEASTVREESPLLVGVEKETQSPLIASAGPQPYELVHPKNAIDVVELPPPAPKLPTTEAEMVANNAAPLPLPPSAQVVARAPEPVVAPTLLPATVVTTRAGPALPASANVVISQPVYGQAATKMRPAVMSTSSRQWKMPRLFDVLLSPYAIVVYVVALAATLMRLPFWLLVALAVLVDAAVIAYRRGEAAKPATLAVVSPPTPAARWTNSPQSLPGPIVSTAITSAQPGREALPAPETPQPRYVRSVPRDVGIDTEVDQASAQPVAERTTQQTVQGKKLAPSARQQAAVPLLADVQPVAPTGVIVDNAFSDSDNGVNMPQRYVQTAPTTPVSAVLPSPSKLPNPMLDALNSASPRRELKELSEAVETYHDMQPASELPPQVQAAAQRAVASIPTPGIGAVQGAANPSVMVPTWPSTEQQHDVAQARQVVEASTVRDHSALLDDDSGMSAAHQSQPYEMMAVPYSRTDVNDTGNVKALPAPSAPVSSTAPLPLPAPIAPSFRVSASDVTPATSIQRVAQTTSPMPLTTQPLTAEEHAVRAVKQVTSEELKEEAVIADVGELDRVSDVGAGIVSDSNGLRLRHVAAHAHNQ